MTQQGPGSLVGSDRSTCITVHSMWHFQSGTLSLIYFYPFRVPHSLREAGCDPCFHILHCADWVSLVSHQVPLYRAGRYYVWWDSLGKLFGQTW